MRSTVLVAFNSEDRPWQVLHDIFLRSGRPDLAARGPDDVDYYTAIFSGDAPELVRLRSELRAEGLSWFENRQHFYSDSELEQFPMLALRVTFAERGFGGPSHGTEYDLTDACTRCGSGAKQISPLMLNAAEIPSKGPIFQTLDLEILVARDVAKRRALTAYQASSSVELTPQIQTSLSSGIK